MNSEIEYMRAFLIILKGRSKDGLEDTLLKAHIAHLKKLSHAGNLIVCGPFTDDQGGMLVIEARSEEDVVAMLQADPFIQEKYYQSYSITEFYKADESNQYLENHDQTIGELLD